MTFSKFIIFLILIEEASFEKKKNAHLAWWSHFVKNFKNLNHDFSKYFDWAFFFLKKQVFSNITKDNQFEVIIYIVPEVHHSYLEVMMHPNLFFRLPCFFGKLQVIIWVIEVWPSGYFCIIDDWPSEEKVFIGHRCSTIGVSWSVSVFDHRFFLVGIGVRPSVLFDWYRCSTIGCFDWYRSSTIVFFFLHRLSDFGHCSVWSHIDVWSSETSTLLGNVESGPLP